MFTRGTIILYADSSSLPGVIIAVGSGTKWTHCAVALGDGTAIQCEATHGGYAVLPEGSGDTTTTILYPKDPESFIAGMLALHGCHYDYPGLLANPLWNIFKWNIGLRKNTWNCATFIAQALPMLTLSQRRKPLAAWCPGDFIGLLL